MAITEYVPDDLNNALSLGILILALISAGFLIFQLFRNKCTVEPIVCVCGLCFYYSIQFFSEGKIVWVHTDHGEIPLGRYYSWLIIWPPLLAQILNLYGLVGFSKYYAQFLFLFIFNQIFVVSLAFSAVSIGTQKYLFFVLSCASGGTLMFQFYLIYYDQKRLFPEDIKVPLYVLTLLYLVSFILYPVLWILGDSGLSVVNSQTYISLSGFVDLVGRLFLALLAWYIRWFYLDNDRVTNTGRILVSRGVNENAKNKFGLSDEELLNAQETPFHILLLDPDLLVQKTVLLMMQDMDVSVSIAFDTIHAIEHLENNPSYLFDCVLVVPSHHQTAFKRQALKDLSELLVKDPYKIPLLALEFSEKEHINDPGEYIHGIIQRPLDEISFCQDLYAWRVTASMWRRVALTMENIENDPNFFPKLEELPEEAQETMATASMRVRRRGSLFGHTLVQNQNASTDSQPPAQPQQVPIVNAEPSDAQRWNYVISNFKRD